MSINQRIEELINKLFSGNQRAFGKAVGVSTAVINSMIGTRKTKPSYEVITKIYRSIENLNPGWLLDGEGPPFLPPVQAPDTSATITNQPGFGPAFVKAARPLIRPVNDHLYKPDAFSNAVNSGECEMVVIAFIEDYDFSLIAQGNSMVNTVEPEKSLPAGSLAACKIWSDPSHIRWGEIYALATTKGYIIKRIFQSDKEGYITCESTNKKGRYKSYDIPVNEILDWAIVVGAGTFNVWI